MISRMPATDRRQMAYLGARRPRGFAPIAGRCKLSLGVGGPARLLTAFYLFHTPNLVGQYREKTSGLPGFFRKSHPVAPRHPACALWRGASASAPDLGCSKSKYQRTSDVR